LGIKKANGCPLLSSLASGLHPHYSSIELLIAIVKANITPTPLRLRESIGAFRGGAPHECPGIPTDWIPSAFIESSAHFFRRTHAISVSPSQLATPITFFWRINHRSSTGCPRKLKTGVLRKKHTCSNDALSRGIFPCHLSTIQCNKLGIANVRS